VRTWIGRERQDGNGPYKFKILLTPLPNKSIEESEEDQTLEDLKLAPSATLLLVPIVRYTEAYSHASDGLVARGINYLVEFFKAILAWLGLLFSGLTGSQSAAPPSSESNSRADAPHQARQNDGARIRGFRNDETRRDYQLYNGNSVGIISRSSIHS
jgi:hypothetical protein